MPKCIHGARKSLHDSLGKAGKEAAEARKKRQKKSSATKKSHGTAMYLVRAEQYGPDREETDHHSIGFYSTKKFALENARVAFEQHFSNGFFQNGE